MSVPVFKMATVGILPSPLKRMYYRMRGAKIGRKVKIGFLSVLQGKEIEIGDRCKIGMFTFISANKIKLGKRVQINMMTAIKTGEISVDNDTIIMEQVIIGGMLSPRSVIRIGKRVKIFPHSFLNPTEPITIGDDVGVGGSNYIFTHATWQNVLDGFPATFGPVTIEKGVWLPWRVFILPNVTIGEYAIIGADSTVSKNIPPRSVAAGSPAEIKVTDGKHLRKLNPDAKHKQVTKILEQFCEYMNYLGHTTTHEMLENGLRIKVLYKSKQKEMVYLRTYAAAPETYQLFLGPLTDEETTKLDQAEKKWIDIDGKKAMYQYKDSFWEEIKNYFSRYGIRFEYLN